VNTACPSQRVEPVANQSQAMRDGTPTEYSVCRCGRRIGRVTGAVNFEKGGWYHIDSGRAPCGYGGGR
jgi:hypothetical protein